MNQLVSLAFILALLTGATLAYGDEIGEKITEQFRENPDRACALLDPLAGTLAKLELPLGAQHRKEVVWRKQAPENFTAVLPLMQVATVAPCAFSDKGDEAKIVIRAIRLIERDLATGQERIATGVTDFSSLKSPVQFTGKLYPRIPRWYEGNPKEAAGASLIEDRSLVINLTGSERLLYHGWVEPQVEILPGKIYLVEMEVKIGPHARLQMGTDYWRTIGAQYLGWQQDCRKSNHCEGHLSNWFGPTEDFVTLRSLSNP